MKGGARGRRARAAAGMTVVPGTGEDETGYAMATHYGVAKSAHFWRVCVPELACNS